MGVVEMQTVRVVRSALFVDFDNLYGGLRDVDATAAHRFATIPQHWLSWLSQGTDEDGSPFRRRFLSKNCYLNPGPHGGFRSFYASSGFRVVDCPSLTRAGKSSADIHLALDVVDALNHPTRYDEFIVCSADADFTPVMVRLRAHDRRTVMIAAGVTAAAYDASCDESIETTAFVEALQRPLISADATTVGNSDATYTAPSPVDDTSENDPQQLGITPEEAAPAVAAIKDAVKESQVPITGAAAAHAARGAAPEVAGRWAGAGGFLSFVRQRVPELKIVRSAGGGWVYDPRRHTPSDIPGAQDDDITAQVCRVTKAPRLTAQQFAVLFEELEADLRRQPFNLTATSVSVRNRTAERGTPVGRGAINFVLQGLLYCGVNFEQNTPPARELARVTKDNLVALSRTAQMQLTEDNVKDIDDWVVGGLT
jgi:hypothetical protein